MKRTTWILATVAAFALTACGPKPNDNAAGSGAETGATADTAMTGGAAPADTGMAPAGTGADTTAGTMGSDTTAH
ncbi:MAG TPA: hypothetical protein VJQ44_17595 [Gemmatimonadales bacterium]|nr:hypothetical protein [Gemmatimonadales bacterium]